MRGLSRKWYRITASFLVVILLCVCSSPTAFAMSAAQRKLFEGKIFAFNEATSCAVIGEANITVSTEFHLGTDPVERRVNLMQALMNDFELTAAQAAGPVGNFMAESGGHFLPPDVNEGGAPGPPAFSGGYGWAQWTAGRQRTFIDYAIQNGYMASEAEHATDAANYAYFKHELTTIPTYQVTVPALKEISGDSVASARAAAVSFEDTFENAGVKRLDVRQNNAEQAFNEYQTSGGGSGAPGGEGCGEGGVVGDNAFPLGPTKSVVKNPGMFANGTADQGGHPYTAYDILADPGTQVRAFASGTVSQISNDRCGGTLISIFNEASNASITYMHLSADGHVSEGDVIELEDDIAVVGSAADGCDTPHLHIDAIQGTARYACSRNGCAPSVRSLFIDIGPQLFNTFQALPD